MKEKAIRENARSNFMLLGRRMCIYVGRNGILGVKCTHNTPYTYLIRIEGTRWSYEQEVSDKEFENMTHGQLEQLLEELFWKYMAIGRQKE